MNDEIDAISGPTGTADRTSGTTAKEPDLEALVVAEPELTLDDRVLDLMDGSSVMLTLGVARELHVTEAEVKAVMLRLCQHGRLFMEPDGGSRILWSTNRMVLRRRAIERKIERQMRDAI